MTKTTAVLLISFALAGVLPGGAVEEKPSLNAFRMAPSYFIPNHGVDKSGRKLVEDTNVRAFVQTGEGRVLFTPAGAFIGIFVREAGSDDAPGSGAQEAYLRGPRGGKAVIGRTDERGDAGRMVVLSAGFGSISRSKTGAGPVISLQEPMPGKVNFFRGSPENWRTDIPTYRKLVYAGVWDGIDVEYLGYMDRLEYRVIVHSGADPAEAVLETGATVLSVDESGALTAELEGVALRMGCPAAWQETDGVRTPVPVEYQVLPDGRVGFNLGTYDPERDLVIDPVLTWSTYLGPDSGNDAGSDITVNASGNAYVTGYTAAANFPTTAGAYDTTHNGSSDVFVTKLNATGSSLVYSTFIGGGGDDYGTGIAVDAAGNAFVTGYAVSSDFPTTAGAYDTTYNGNGANGSGDAFIIKLNTTGSALVYSTFIGGNDGDYGYGIAVNTSSNAYVTGYTYSSNFPTTAGAYDTTSNGGLDQFVAKLGTTGSTLVYCTFIGGNGTEYGDSIAIDTSGSAYITGYTNSTNFPVTAGAYDTTLGGTGGDVFVTKLNTAGSALVFSTFIGGSATDSGNGIAVDSSGNTYMTGRTYSTDFPTTAGAYDTTQNSYSYADVFMTKLNAAGTSLVFSTFLGGVWDDNSNDITVDHSGNVFVTGDTNSADFPMTGGAYDTSLDGLKDSFVAKLNTVGSTLLYSTFLGGSSNDYGSGIVVDTSGNAYVTGYTESSDFPTTGGAYDTTNGSGRDSFVLVLAIASGDLNHDGVVNSTDIPILSAYLTGAALPSGTMPADCLLTPDGVINAADLCWLKNRVAGNIH